jgi:hypothetical protein
MKDLCMDAYIDYSDARCYKSLSGPILVWDFGDRHWMWDVMLFQLA